MNFDFWRWTGPKQNRIFYFRFEAKADGIILIFYRSRTQLYKTVQINLIINNFMLLILNY